MKSRITVNEYHIWHGLRCSSTECPIAMAVAEAFPNTHVEVGRDIVSVTRPGDKSFMSVMPFEVERLVRRFDHGNRMQPFSFELQWEIKQ